MRKKKNQASGLFAQGEALTELGNILYTLLPEGAVELELAVRGATASTDEHTMVVVYGDGSRFDLRSEFDIMPAVDKLRTAMYRPGAGTWFSARFVVTDQAAIDSEYNYDEEPQWFADVVPDTYVHDLQRFPRNPENIPDWLQRKLDEAPAEAAVPQRVGWRSVGGRGVRAARVGGWFSGVADRWFGARSSGGPSGLKVPQEAADGLGRDLDDATEPLGGFLDAIAKLPEFNGVAFRGLSSGEEEPPQVGVVTGVIASSRSARVASENFTATRLLVLLNRTGRSVAEFSEHPEEGEVVVRPGSVWHRLIEVTIPGLQKPALVLEELDPSGRTPTPTEWGDTRAELAARVVSLVRQGMTSEQATVAVPGKFSGPWPAQALPAVGK